MFPEISGMADISGMTKILQKYTNRHSILA